MTFQAPEDISSKDKLKYVSAFKKLAEQMLANSPEAISSAEILERARAGLTQVEQDRLYNQRNIPLATYLIRRALHLLEKEGKIGFRNSNCFYRR